MPDTKCCLDHLGGFTSDWARTLKTTISLWQKSGTLRQIRLGHIEKSSILHQIRLEHIEKSSNLGQIRHRDMVVLSVRALVPKT